MMSATGHLLKFLCSKGMSTLRKCGHRLAVIPEDFEHAACGGAAIARGDGDRWHLRRLSAADRMEEA